ncbi:MAG: hypothetical protein M0D55_18930 [Elusimicrobiota bacterium]|nr:MAG: hypothetical protein M0D55_18930 [Elusimicrobiota bacterium]
MRGSESIAAKAAINPSRIDTHSPRAIQLLTSAASAPEKLEFDGASAKSPSAAAAPAVPAAPSNRGAFNLLKKGLKTTALALSITIASLGIQAPAAAQTAPATPPPSPPPLPPPSPPRKSAKPSRAPSSSNPRPSTARA